MYGAYSFINHHHHLNIPQTKHRNMFLAFTSFQYNYVFLQIYILLLSPCQTFLSSRIKFKLILLLTPCIDTLSEAFYSMLIFVSL